MINFFRKIRQNMLTENKVSKYLLYAIGEIILVVIGILIALQVNNWNQERYQKETEAIYLTQLLEETRADSIFFQSRLVLFEKQSTCYTQLIQLCAGTLSDSLLASIPTRDEEPFVMAALGSATLKSIAQDGEKISDPGIKQRVRHYEQRYEFVSKIIGLLNDDIKLYGRGLLIPQARLSTIGIAISEYNVLCEEENFNGIMALLLGDLRDAERIVQTFLTANETLTRDINEYLVSNQ
jgi:hypothetical protein